MTSLRKIYDDKTLRGDMKKPNTFAVPLDRVYEEDGFNICQHDDESIAEMRDCWLSGTKLPPIIVESQNDGTFKLIDGHRRRLSACAANEIKPGCVTHLQAEESGLDTEVDQVKFMIGTKQTTPLKPWELSLVIKRLKDLGEDNESIAKTVKRGVSNVKHHIAVASLPPAVFELIKQGRIQDSLALEIYRKQCEQAVIDAVTMSKGPKVRREDTKLYNPKRGKRTVEILSEVSYTSKPDGSGVTFDIPTDLAQEIIAAIESLKYE